MKRTVIVAAAAALLCLPLFSPALATSEGLPPECREALLAEKAWLDANRETAHPADAILRLQLNAGPPCGFDLTGATPTTTDREAMAAFLASIGAGGAPSEEGDDEGPIGPVDGPQLDASRAVESAQAALAAKPCLEPGAGPGTITATVLGVELRSFAAEGEWGAQAEAKEHVEGTMGTMSGSQLNEDAGTIFIAALPVVSTKGTASITCVTITTRQVIETTCEAGYQMTWLGPRIYSTCKEVVDTKTEAVPCASTAMQRDELMLLRMDHTYKVQDPPEGC